MWRRSSVLILGLLLAALGAACKDDSLPPATYDRGLVDGGKRDGRDAGHPWDGFDPLCPMPGPCVIESKGEGKHAEPFVVIGETLTLTGKELGAVDTVYIGAAIAPLLSVSATKVVCRVGPGSPSGGPFALEVKAGTARRKAKAVDVRRLVAVAAADHAQLQTFEATTRGGGPTLTLPEAPAAPLVVSGTGRYLLARGATKTIVVDLAREQVATVDGLAGESVVSLAAVDDDRRLLLATASGKLLAAELSGFPTLVAAPVVGAPATTAVVDVPATPAGLVAGLHPTAASGEGSLWSAAADLKTFTFAQQGGKPLLLGAGKALAPLALASADGVLALLVLDVGGPQLALLTVAGGKVAGEGSGAASGALGVVIAAGGAQVALAVDGAAPALSYAGVAGALSLKSVALGGSGAVRVQPLRLPLRPAAVAALVGPQPAAAAPFVAGALELVDLAGAVRLAAAGNKPLLELAGMRAAVGDPTLDAVHVLTAGEYRAFTLALAGTIATATEKLPIRTLVAGKDYRWLAIQP